jgi:hypothetical protein
METRPGRAGEEGGTRPFRAEPTPAPAGVPDLGEESGARRPEGRSTT